MKNITRIVFTTMLLLLFYSSSNGQGTITNGATYYVCQGSSYAFFFPVTGPKVSNPYYWKFDSNIYACSIPPCTFSNGVTVNYFYKTTIYSCPEDTASDYYGFNATFNTAFPIKMTVAVVNCPSSGGVVTFTIIPYVSKIAGDTGICGTGPGTYTVTVNGDLTVTNYAWTLPPFLSGTSGTNIISASGSASILSYGTVSVIGNGCPYGSPSNYASLYVYDVPSAPSSAPGGNIYYTQYGRSCWWNGYVPSVTNAAEYQWCFDSTFSPTYTVTSTPTTTTGPFLLDTHTYTVYVRGANKCGPGPFTQYIKETPEAPAGCIHQPTEREAKQGQALAAFTDYKVYPNPAANRLMIEYPGSLPTSVLTFRIYNMLGQKMANCDLPASENIISQNVSFLSPGVYIYEIASGKGILVRGKLMIQR